MLGKIYRVRCFLFSSLLKVYVTKRFKKITVGQNFRVFGHLHLSLKANSTLAIGNNLTLKSSTIHNYVGINKPCSIAVSNDAELIIGNNCGMSGTSIFASTKIIIGDYCNFGGNTCLWDTDFHPIDYLHRRAHLEEEIRTAPIIIGNDVFVGANSIILKGVTVGDRSIIGAGSVVTKNIPPDEIWAGNPARFIKKIS